MLNARSSENLRPPVVSVDGSRAGRSAVGCAASPLAHVEPCGEVPDRRFFGGGDLDGVLKDSAALGWTGVYAALTRELTGRIERPPVPAVWIALFTSPVELDRLADGCEHRHLSLPRNAIAVVPPGTAVHDALICPGDALHVFISEKIVSQVVSSSFGGNAPTPVLAPHVRTNDPLLSQILQGVALALDDDSSSSRLKADFLARALVAHVLGGCRERDRANAEAGAQQWPELTTRQMQMVEDYIDDNLTRAVAIADLAQLLGLSRAQLLRRYKATTRTTPHQTVMAARVERARALLADAALPLPDIARQAGFANAAHFSTVFSRFIGMSPSVYRRHLR